MITASCRIQPCCLFLWLVFSACPPVGIMDTNKIPDNRMTASSSYRMSELPHYGRLNETRQNGAWCPKSRNNSEYLQVDMGTVYYVCAVETQGRAADYEWVTAYILRFSLDGIIWNSYYENNVEKVSKLDFWWFGSEMLLSARYRKKIVKLVCVIKWRRVKLGNNFNSLAFFPNPYNLLGFGQNASEIIP